MKDKNSDNQNDCPQEVPRSRHTDLLVDCNDMPPGTISKIFTEPKFVETRKIKLFADRDDLYAAFNRRAELDRRPLQDLTGQGRFITFPLIILDGEE